jgi:hypothetical protein
VERDHGPPAEGAASFHTTRWTIVMRAARMQTVNIAFRTLKKLAQLPGDRFPDLPQAPCLSGTQGEWREADHLLEMSIFSNMKAADT